MKTVALLAVVPALLGQALIPSPRELLNVARPLTGTEITTVLNASREALTAKTFRLSSVPNGRIAEVLMGPAGLPRIIRSTYRINTVGGVPGGSTTHSYKDVMILTDYTGRPARDCDGSAEEGEMVIEYELPSSTQSWTATARRRRPGDSGGIARALEMLRGIGPVTSGERRQIGGRWARAFDSPVPTDQRSEAPIVTGDPMPNVLGDPPPSKPIQSLWIDTESLFPLRWEVSLRPRPTYGFDFTYESIDLGPPTGVQAPQCVR